MTILPRRAFPGPRPSMVLAAIAVVFGWLGPSNGAVAGEDKKPDIIIESATMIRPLHPNYDISYKFTIRNIGGGKADFDGKGCTVQAWLVSAPGTEGSAADSPSSDSQPGAKVPAGGLDLTTAKCLARCLTRLNPRQTYKAEFGCTVPSYDPEKYTHLLLKVDSHNQLDESNEDNNTILIETDL